MKSNGGNANESFDDYTDKKGLGLFLEKGGCVVFLQFFGTGEHESREMHIRDALRPPPNFREIQGG